MTMLDALDYSIGQAASVDISIVAAAAALFDNTNMAETIDGPPVYRALMELKPADLSTNKWATDAGLARNAFQNLREHGNPKIETLQALLDVIDVSLSEFDARMGPVRANVATPQSTGARDTRDTFYAEPQLPPIPLLGTAAGGEYENIDEKVETVELSYSQVIEYIARPAALAKDENGYALIIVGESMVPRFKPRERVAVSPRAPVSVGDDVIVQLRGPDGEDGERVKLVLIKELVKRNSSHLELRQYNPPMTFRVETARVAAIHKVTSGFY